MLNESKQKVRGPHPTKMKLRDAVVEMMIETPPEEIHSEVVLQETGISRGSLYHHYEDFTELLEDAMLHRFSSGVEASTGAIQNIVANSADQAEFLSLLQGVTRATQDRKLADSRFDRARMLAMAQHNLRFRAKLAEVQDRLTDALTECFAQAQDKGWLNRDFDPRTGAIFIQAYTLGKLVDDVSAHPMDDRDWENLITLIADRALANRKSH
ncbi:MAG: TetR/AcrR family transcriptional regulator [Candidatus Nanopelagicales bacterium]|jgi:AcrR family transcriptional regulator